MSKILPITSLDGEDEIQSDFIPLIEGTQAISTKTGETLQRVKNLSNKVKNTMSVVSAIQEKGNADKLMKQAVINHLNQVLRDVNALLSL